MSLVDGPQPEDLPAFLENTYLFAFLTFFDHGINPSGCSDCLYFSVQEEPLSATVTRRLRRPHGVAILSCATRNGWGKPSLQRFIEELRAAGFHVRDEVHAWDWEALVVTHANAGASRNTLAATTTETGDHHILEVTWEKAVVKPITATSFGQ